MMTRPDVPQRTREPSTSPRITVMRIGGRTWLARTEGAGAGPAWGKALATLDYRSHARGTSRRGPTYWIDTDALRTLIVECTRMGVAIVAVDDSTLPSRVR